MLNTAKGTCGKPLVTFAHFDPIENHDEIAEIMPDVDFFWGAQAMTREYLERGGYLVEPSNALHVVTQHLSDNGHSMLKVDETKGEDWASTYVASPVCPLSVLTYTQDCFVLTYVVWGGKEVILIGCGEF